MSWRDVDDRNKNSWPYFCEMKARSESEREEKILEMFDKRMMYTYRDFVGNIVCKQNFL